jgi:AcrR family transcriptional regulator
MPGQVRHRRRGEQLERALLDAAWHELVDVGFTGLTMESVAARARTGIAVLYRRWANKDELVLAAIDHYGRTRPARIPDTGTLRGDLLALLTNVSGAGTMFTTAVAAAFSGLLAGTGLTPVQVRDRLVGNRPLWSEEIFHRAHERGEIDLRRIPPVVLAMPFDLLRHDLLMSLTSPEPERVRTIIDEMFLPLVAHSQRSAP